MVTCTVPSERVIVPKAPVTPLPAVGVAPPDTVKAGQLAMQAPEQLLTPGVSFCKIYKVFPLASVRILPRVALLVTITVAPPAGAAVEVAPVLGSDVAAVVGAAVGAVVAVAAVVGAVVAMAADVAVGWTAGV